MKFCHHKVWLFSIAAIGLAGTATAQTAGNIKQSNDPWYTQGQAALAAAKAKKPITGPAKNIILFIGDAMGPTTVTAARILEGQLRGKSGEENLLVFEKFPHLALSKTYNTNQQVSDSAGTATAILSGVKTKAGVIGVDSTVVRNDCKSSIGHHVTTALELAEIAGKSTGVVTTARITHATPAAAYAHAANRSWEDDKDMKKAEDASACKDIARQLIEFPFGDGIEVAMGGGRHSFLPKTIEDPEAKEKKGERQDGRDLTKEWTKKYKNSAYIWNQAQFDAIDPAKTDHLLALFNKSHMTYEFERVKKDKGGEPSLSQMTAKAIDILAKNPKGFFIEIEAARIDHAHHFGNAFRALTETIELAKAVQVAIDKTDVNNTLIIVTADHSFGFTLGGGYPARGNPILGLSKGVDGSGRPTGKPSLAKNDKKPYTTLNYVNGPGAIVGEREDLTNVNTTDPNYKQQSMYTTPLGRGIGGTHSGEDVAIYARGPGAYLFDGVVEQNYIFHVMNDAAGLSR
jgi:alkaline phosphatase